MKCLAPQSLGARKTLDSDNLIWVNSGIVPLVNAFRWTYQEFVDHEGLPAKAPA